MIKYLRLSQKTITKQQQQQHQVRERKRQKVLVGSLSCYVDAVMLFIKATTQTFTSFSSQPRMPFNRSFIRKLLSLSLSLNLPVFLVRKFRLLAISRLSSSSSSSSRMGRRMFARFTTTATAAAVAGIVEFMFNHVLFKKA